MQASYNLGPLYAAGKNGSGYTIGIVDSYGSDTMAQDLNVFDTAFGLQHMCGEVDATTGNAIPCTSGMPTFSETSFQGSPATKQQGNGNSNGTGLEDKTGWAIEVALDVEWAHAIAPGANILLIHTPTAETLGLQGFPLMMNAEDAVVTHKPNPLADVITQSFGASEDSFGSPNALLSLRGAFQDAQANHVTVLASTGDFGSTNQFKQSLLPGPNNGAVLPEQNIGWPASDPLVTAVGGTYLCTNPVTGTGVDSTDPPSTCQTNPGVREIGWIDSGGGFSHVFSRPSYQDTLPAGSTPIPSTSRGIPDVAYQASSRTGPLIYVTLPPDGSGSNVGDAGWYIIGGTSASSPQWAGLVAIADQIAGHRLGFINPALYALANGPGYATYFYDVTHGNNGAFAPDVPGYPATTGWDPVTGLGTPNAATLLPALAAAAG
jgi:subtilase family serine protease